MSDKNDLKESAHFAVILADPTSEITAVRLGRLLEFLGVSWRRVSGLGELQALPREEQGGVLLAALPLIPHVFETLGSQVSHTFHSVFAYLTSDIQGCTESLRLLGSNDRIQLDNLEGAQLEVSVSGTAEVTGPMHQIHCSSKISPSERLVTGIDNSSVQPIIASSRGLHFFSVAREGISLFINASSAVPDLAAPLAGRRYDVKEDFLSTVPWLIYLKWALRDVCWHSPEASACWIVDDPVLKSNYGFCNFPQLDQQMRKHDFSLNVAFIPWNWRRTSSEMASLIKESGGRLSVSVHGCDHTGGEFGSRSAADLGAKVSLAKWRMEKHRDRTGISHDPIMVFPQGIFSQESMRVLQKHHFTAAVNTELSPSDKGERTVTIEDAWSPAIMRAGGVPLFTRRYPVDGLENFAFDLLLGKPCLLVEHHAFFKNNGAEVVKFVDRLNSLNCRLHWRGLGDVIRRSFHCRNRKGQTQVRLSANEALLANTGAVERSFAIEQIDGSAREKRILLDGEEVKWERKAGSLSFEVNLLPGQKVLVETRSSPEQAPTRMDYPPKTAAKIALRRLASEFRDNFFDRYPKLMLCAGGPKKNHQLC